MFAHKISSALISRTPEIIRGNGLTPAAVLIPIQERADGDYIVLTKRGDDMPTHKGQIAFPGGRMHVGDADLMPLRCARARKRSASIRNMHECSAV